MLLINSQKGIIREKAARARSSACLTPEPQYSTSHAKLKVSFPLKLVYEARAKIIVCIFRLLDLSCGSEDHLQDVIIDLIAAG